MFATIIVGYLTFLAGLLIIVLFLVKALKEQTANEALVNLSFGVTVGVIMLFVSTETGHPTLGRWLSITLMFVGLLCVSFACWIINHKPKKEEDHSAATEISHHG